MNMLSMLEGVPAALAGNVILERLFWASVELAVLSALVWAGVHVFRVQSPRIRAMLWLVVLIKPITALCFGAAVPLLRIEAPAPVVAVTPAPLPPDTAIAENAPATRAEAGSYTEAARPAEPAQASEAGPKSRPPLNTGQEVVLLWAWAAALLAAYRGLDAVRLHRLMRRAHAPEGVVAAQFEAAARALSVKRPPRLRVSEEIESPALAGTFKPVILLPHWMIESASPAALDWALRHELAHWKLGDTVANFVRQIAQVLFFFHPAVWWAGAGWEEAAELACDRALVNSQDDADNYAGNLYQVLAQLHGRRQRFLAGGLCATRTQVGRRIAALLGNPLRYRARLGLWAVSALLVCAATALGVGGVFESASVSAQEAPAATANVTGQVAEAIATLSTTSEMQVDRVTGVFDSVKALPGKEALAALCPWLDNDEATKRRSAVYIIQMLEWPDPSPAFEQLRALLTHDEALTRGMASMALASQGDTASYDAMVEMALHDKDPYARRTAAWALGELGDPRALAPLAEIAQGQTALITGNAQNAIDRLTLLEENKGVAGDTARVVRGIFVIAGSTPYNKERLDRARGLIMSVDKEARDAVLTKLAESPSEAIRNSVTFARTFESEAPSSKVAERVAEAVQTISSLSEIQAGRISAALASVEALPGKEALAALCPWLDNGVPVKRRSAVYIIQMLDWPDASPAFPQLRSLMGHEEALTRGMAAMALASQGDTASYDAIVEMALHDKDPYAQRSAAWALGELGDPRALEPLAKLTERQDALITMNAQNAIDRLTLLDQYKNVTGDSTRIVRGIFIIAGSTPHQKTRIDRARGLIMSVDKDAREAVLSKLSKSPSEAIRNSVTFARTFEGEAASSKAVEKVAEAVAELSITSEMQTAHVSAIFDSIKALPNEEALAALCPWLDNDEATKRRSAVYLIQMLDWRDPSPAFPPLRALMKHGEALTRGMAAMALASQGDTASYDAIAEMALHDEDPYARRSAAWALGELGDPRAMEPLAEIAKGQAALITGNAQNALERLTLLAEYKGATGDTAQIVRGINIIAGSTQYHLERLERARVLLLATDKPTRDAVLSKLAESPSESVRRGVAYARAFEKAPAARLQFRWEAKEDAAEFDELPERGKNGAPETNLRVEKATIVDETDIAAAKVRQDDAASNMYNVYFVLKDTAAERFKEATGANVDRRLAIIFDGQVISAPVVRSSIAGEGMVTCSDRELAERIAAIFQKPSRKDAPAWSPEQATGMPDTPEAGDLPTAWASLTQDDTEEWLLLQYDIPVEVARIHVHESFNPGALKQIDAVNEQGESRRIWEGQDPTPPTEKRGVSEITLDQPVTTAAVKLYFDSPATPGWNEIDAVGLLDAAGHVYWASGAEASSSYADREKQKAEEEQPQTLNVSARSRDLPMPERYTLLSHVNDTAEDKRSFGGSGHAVRFTRTAADGANLVAVQIGASRYGSAQAPGINFNVYLLDEQYNILHNAQYAYAEIDQGPLMWYTFRVNATAVPETFLVALDFHADQFEGVYVGMDRYVTESHSLTGVPGQGFQPVEGEPFDWMIRACLSDEAPAWNDSAPDATVEAITPDQEREPLDAMPGVVELKHDSGQPQGQQSYGGGGPSITFDLASLPKPQERKGAPVLLGLRVYGSRYGGGYDPQQTTFTVNIKSSEGQPLSVTLPYTLFDFQEAWVDLVLPEALVLPRQMFENGTLTVSIDPAATQSKGLYFFYAKPEGSSHSSAVFGGPATPVPDREWMIRAYVR